MKSKTKEFKSAASTALRNSKIQSGLRGLYDGFHKARIRAADDTPGWEDMRTEAKLIKDHTINNLDYYLGKVYENVTKAGGKVHFAESAKEANTYVQEVAQAGGVKRVIKGKSMLSEEIGLNDHLAQNGIKAIETDLGEYILQLAGQTPFHIVAPAIHMSKGDVSDILSEKTGIPKLDKIEDLATAARDQLRREFIRADMGITGVNFLVADTGTVVLVTNEGNGRMCTSMPRIHIAIMGLEKIIPSMNQLGLFLRLLTRSATGQRITSYISMVNGPRAHDEEDGPDEFHLVIVDNGRSKLIADPEMREALNCIRCGACLNACPVYRKVGGHTYGWVYSGPIGAVINPMLTNLEDSKDLPFASSLCGACKEVCPIKIDIPRMLLHLRKEFVNQKTHKDSRISTLWEKFLIKIWRFTVTSPLMMRLANRLGRTGQTLIPKQGHLRWLPHPISGWTRYRNLPKIASVPFRKRWDKYLR